MNHAPIRIDERCSSRSTKRKQTSPYIFCTDAKCLSVALWTSVLVLVSWLFSLQPVTAFYIAAQAPTRYRLNDPVPIYWNKIYPSGDHLGLPYSYADLPFVCHPAQWELPYMNLGRSLAGDQLVRSDIQLEMGRNETCKVLCRRQITPESAQMALNFIRDQYVVEWFLDGLPISQPWVNIYDRNKQHNDGFPLGYYDPLADNFFIYNHFIIHVLYEKSTYSPGHRLIVGVEIYPKSVENQGLTCLQDASIPGMLPQGLDADTRGITYTYSVVWQEESSVTWGRRWDSYLYPGSDKTIHWFSIINAVVIFFLVSLTAAFIAIRVLGISIPYINEDAYDQEELGPWKQLHGDVFRIPAFPQLLATLTGSGLQILYTFIVILFIAVLGLFNPSFPGGLVTIGIFVYVFSGLFAGYTSARLCRAFEQLEWKKNAVHVAVLVPGSIYLLIVFLNFFNWAKGAATSISFGVFIALLTLWICIMGPIVVGGAYLGERQPPLCHPVHTSLVRRMIPRPPWYMRTVPSLLLTGILPFGTIFLEEYLLLRYLWSDRYYYFYGFLCTSFLLLVAVSILITLIMIYFQLCSEDYRWWWRSFLLGGSPAIYIFAYAILHAVLQMHGGDMIAGFLYVMHALAASLVIGIALGAISFITTYYVLRKLFKTTKAN